MQQLIDRRGEGARDHFAEGERGQGPFGRGGIGLGAMVKRYWAILMSFKNELDAMTARDSDRKLILMLVSNTSTRA
jgi:hypothetical protein